VISGDAGRAINHLACRGQDEGAAVMAYSQALFEQMVYLNGRLINGEPLLYRVPLAEDLPSEFIAITQEQGRGPGPFGAKGMGEGGILPIASAIANAVEDAVGVRVTSLPITPEKILRALDARRNRSD
jgi:CO/xanthine dehydrogenase Mo-binding subunit